MAGCIRSSIRGDRLAFFGNKEPFSATPLVARVDSGRIVLPIGEVHGVRKGSEFTTYPPTSHVTFSVDQVADFECSAPALLIDVQAVVARPPPSILPSQTPQARTWGCGCRRIPSPASTDDDNNQDCGVEGTRSPLLTFPNALL